MYRFRIFQKLCDEHDFECLIGNYLGSRESSFPYIHFQRTFLPRFKYLLQAFLTASFLLPSDNLHTSSLLLLQQLLDVQNRFISTSLQCRSKIEKWALPVAPHQKISGISGDLGLTHTTTIVDSRV
jgi:hypothetical protein